MVVTQHEIEKIKSEIEFLSKPESMLRPDCKEPYWKEKFIAGLPNLFAEKVRNNLREKYNNQIPYL